MTADELLSHDADGMATCRLCGLPFPSWVYGDDRRAIAVGTFAHLKMYHRITALSVPLDVLLPESVRING